ncbi:MAG: DUF4337 family protein [Bradyrhizobium sp.]|nr:MAG: DUF4337 family protein [Bradyrhizobium sp.]
MAEPLEDAVDADDKRIALLIAILALFLALGEAGAKNAEHKATDLNIEASDLYNFYQAKKLRSTLAETAAQSLEAERAAVSDSQAQAVIDKQIAAFQATVAKFEKDPKSPEDSLDAIQERAKAATEGRELYNRKLEHFEYASGALQIAVVLASAAIITGVASLAWLAGGLGLLGAALWAFGYLAPAALPFFG